MERPKLIFIEEKRNNHRLITAYFTITIMCRTQNGLSEVQLKTIKRCCYELRTILEIGEKTKGMDLE